MSEGKSPNRLDFSHVETWVFDLDNTLYPAECRLFDQVDRRIGQFIAELLGVDPKEARRIQKNYFREHGTTLSGLMVNHGVEPQGFLEYVHDIDLSSVEPSEALDAALGRLSGRKLIYTNASAEHAEKVMARLGVRRHFEGVFDITAGAYIPKPRPESFRKLIERHGIEPPKTLIIDDISHNLLPAAELGMTTVWVRSKEDWAQPGEDSDHLHHIADDLLSWLESITSRG